MSLAMNLDYALFSAAEMERLDVEYGYKKEDRILGAMFILFSKI